jgi:uncharacterized membrane protein
MGPKRRPFANDVKMAIAKVSEIAVWPDRPSPSTLFVKRHPMSNKQILSAALASVMALGLSAQASAMTSGDEAASGKEKCYGVAKAGANSCANLTDTHGCAGQSTKDKDPAEWKVVPKGQCAKMGGLNKDQALAAIAAAKSAK